MSFRVVFVCSGNTCRSPLAEVIARRELAGAGVDSVHVSSAGTVGETGGCASSGSLEVARQHGLDLETFVSRALTQEIVDEADLILVMEPGHRSSVLGLSPTADTKTWVLGEFAGKKGTEAVVPDPFGGSIDSYRRTYDKIENFLREGLSRLLELAAPGAEGSAKE